MKRTGPRRSSDETRLIRLPLAALSVVAAAAAALGLAFLVGMRTKSPGVQGVVKRMNKNFWNPRAMETAGMPGAYASIVHHVGRRSGTTYQTPVVPVKTDDGFVIALPYGPGTDWVQNVLAAGRATITHEGETYEVERPSVVPIDGLEVSFGGSDAQMHRIFGVEQCLRLRHTTTSPDGSGGAADSMSV